MNYYDAAKIRKKGFANLMTDKLTSGQGVVSSFRGALSDRSKARSMAMKEKFDPMNIAKFLTGGSKLAPAILGRLTGRSKEDIGYFTGKRRYERQSSGGRTGGGYWDRFNNPNMGGSKKATEVLEKIVSFMEKSSEVDKEEQATLDSQSEMNELVKNHYHKEVMDVFNEAIKKKRKAMKDMAKETKKREAEEKAKEKTEQKKTETKVDTKAETPKTDAADAAKKAKDAKDAADAAKKAKDAKDAADAAKKAKDTAKAVETAPPALPTATPAPPTITPKLPMVKPAIEAAKTAAKVSVGVAVGTAALLGKESLAKNIAKYESTASAGKSFGGDEYNAYNRGTKDNKILGATAPVDFSKITISEYLKRSKLPIDDPNRLFAVGRYQIIPKTMQGLIKQLKMDPDTTYLTPTVQDYLFSKGLIDINRKKVSDYIEGRTNGIDARNEAILQLSKEFASVGVPFDTYRIDKIKQKDGSIKEVRIELKKGSSYYSGIGGNKAHNPPELVAAALDEDRAKKLKISPAEIPRNVGEEMISNSTQNADMKKDVSQSGATISPTVIQNNVTNKQRNITVPSAPLEELNPRMRR